MRSLPRLIVSEIRKCRGGIYWYAITLSPRLSTIGIQKSHQLRIFNNGKLARIGADYAHAAALAAHGVGKKKR